MLDIDNIGLQFEYKLIRTQVTIDPHVKQNFCIYNVKFVDVQVFFKFYICNKSGNWTQTFNMFHNTYNVSCITQSGETSTYNNSL